MVRRTISFLAATALALTLSSGAFAAGKDDGPPYTMAKRGCLDVHKHLVSKDKCATPAPAAAAAPAATATAKTAKQCKKGKPCGNTCIAMSDTCHK